MQTAGITPSMVFAAVLAFCGAVATIATAFEKISNAIKAARAPNKKQDERIDALESWKDGDFKEWKKEVDRKLNRNEEQLDSIHDGLQASFKAQLALLDHGIGGNNIKQMQDAKEALQKHLISHK